MSMEWVMLSNHLSFCCFPLLLPSVFPSISFPPTSTCLYCNFTSIFLCFNTFFKKLSDPVLLFYGWCYSNPWRSLFNSTPNCILNIPFSPCTRRCPHLPPANPDLGSEPSSSLRWVCRVAVSRQTASQVQQPAHCSRFCPFYFTHCPPCGLVDFSKYNSRHVSHLLKISPWLHRMPGIKSKLFFLAQWV